MPIRILSIFMVLLLSSNTYASDTCLELLIEKRSGVDINGDFDPVEALKNTGLDFKKLSIKVKNVPHGPTNEEDDYIELSLMDGKNEIGTLDPYSFSENDWGTYSGLNDEYRGRGIGALMYLIGAEIIFRLYSEAKSLQSWDASNSANYMWEKLVRTEHAVKTTEDPDSEPDKRWVYILKREHITPKLSDFITSMRVQGAASVKSAINKKD